MLYETTKLNKGQLCMEHSHLYKHKSEIVNNSTQLCFSFPFLRCFAQTNYLYMRKNMISDLQVSYFSVCNFIMCIVK